MVLLLQEYKRTNVISCVANTKFVPLYSCNNNITLKMAAVAAETC